MPVLTVNTNVPASSVPSDFKSQATQLVAKSLGKPASYVAVHVLANQDMSFGGSSEPAALCNLLSIGCLDEKANKKHSKAIMELLERSLGVPPSRTYITFQDESKANIGYDGTTFADLL